MKLTHNQKNIALLLPRVIGLIPVLIWFNSKNDRTVFGKALMVVYRAEGNGLKARCRRFFGLVVEMLWSPV